MLTNFDPHRCTYKRQNAENHAPNHSNETGAAAAPPLYSLEDLAIVFEADPTLRDSVQRALLNRQMEIESANKRKEQQL